MKDELLTRLRAAQKAFRQAVQGLPPEVRDQRPIENWTVKDVVGHVAFWRGVDREVIQAAQAGSSPRLGFEITCREDLDEVNAYQVACRRSWSWEEVWRELEREEQAFLATVEALTEEQLTLPAPAPWPDPGTVADCIRVEAEHQLQHAQRIQEWRRRLGL
ncbi:MAG TPA: DinB family protein [Candidatus Acetothermia bacterium]|nr:DinB family protein [Candidatus Acetothermia bacterium]